MNSTNLIEDLRLLSPPGYGGWLIPGVVAILLAGLFLLLRQRNRPSSKQVTANPNQPLWEQSLAELEQLTPLLTKASSREYGIKSTQVLRRYIERRYALRAPRLATEEFLIVAGESRVLPEDHRAGLRRFLELCDLLKFGRYLAAGPELERLHGAAVEFVLASRPVFPGTGVPKEAGC